jgi:putative transposase
MSKTTPELPGNHPLWEQAVRREACLRQLMRKKKPIRAAELRAYSKELNVSPSYVYQLLKRYEIDQRVSSLLPRKSGPREGSSRLSEAVSKLIEDAIGEYYLSAQKPKVSKLVQLIAQRCHKAGLRCPSRKAIDSRVRDIDLGVLLAAREGRKAVNNRVKPVVGTCRAEYPLQIVQVDHTKVDVFVVDEQHRLPLQRPWLTLLVDVVTRMITGYHLSFEAPSSISVALALQHSVLPKEEWLREHDIAAPWPVHGLPEILHMDNAKEFHAEALKHGAEEYGIRLFYRPPATPHYGGHIERLIGTMMAEVHLLPGTTFSDIDDRGDYDPQRHAVMTLKDLDQWLAIQIVRQYHHQVHSALCRPPIAVWAEFAARGDISVRLPQDRQHFFYDLLPYEYREVRRDGITLFGIKYWDDVLSVWAGRSLGKIMVRYDPRNLSSVFVRAPDGTYIPARYRHLGRPPVTLWEYNAGRRALREQGRRECDEQMIFEAIVAKRALVDAAGTKTKTARRLRERAMHALPPPELEPQTVAIENKSAEKTPRPKLLPYPIEEWS